MAEVAIAEGSETHLWMPLNKDVGIAIVVKQFIDFDDAGCDVCGLLDRKSVV